MPRKPFTFTDFQDFRTAGAVASYWKEDAGDLIKDSTIRKRSGKRRWPAKMSIGFPNTYDSDTETYTPTKFFVVSRPEKKKRSFLGLFRRGN